MVITETLSWAQDSSAGLVPALGSQALVVTMGPRVRRMVGVNESCVSVPLVMQVSGNSGH